MAKITTDHKINVSCSIECIYEYKFIIVKKFEMGDFFSNFQVFYRIILNMVDFFHFQTAIY